MALQLQDNRGNKLEAGKLAAPCFFLTEGQLKPILKFLKDVESNNRYQSSISSELAKRRAKLRCYDEAFEVSQYIRTVDYASALEFMVSLGGSKDISRVARKFGEKADVNEYFHFYHQIAKRTSEIDRPKRIRIVHRWLDQISQHPITTS